MMPSILDLDCSDAGLAALEAEIAAGLASTEPRDRSTAGLPAGKVSLHHVVPSGVEIGAPYTPKPDAPDWCQPRGFVKRVRHRKRLLDRVPNPCKCNSYAATGKIGPRAVRPIQATDLCICQIELAWQVSYAAGADPCDQLRGLFLFGALVDGELMPPTPEDREYVSKEIEKNKIAWEYRAPMTTAEHQALYLRIGCTLEQWDSWHGEGAKRREASRHHTH